MSQQQLDLGDDKQVRKRNSNVRAKDIQLDEAIKWVQSTKQGRAFLAWLLGICGIGNSAFSTSALIMSHNCGEQNIGNQLLGKLTARDTIDNYVLMLKEQGEKDDSRRTNPSGPDYRASDDGAADD